MTGGRPADEQASAALEASQRRHPGFSAREVDDDVDAAIVAAPLRLAVFLDRPFREIDFLVVDGLVGAECLELCHFPGAARAGDDFGAEQLAQNDAAGADPAARTQDQNA